MHEKEHPFGSVSGCSSLSRDTANASFVISELCMIEPVQQLGVEDVAPILVARGACFATRCMVPDILKVVQF